ncbi:MAG: Arm DNA-binding domain-containing protein, partial [Methylococcaceae bacterium]|nr:Arm DNA-binding domain-containing protein [Methylococcaceae bacterium]
MAKDKITDLAYRKLKATDKVQMIADGDGLYVRVRTKDDGGAKSFMFDYRFEGKQCRITLTEAKSLPEARELRDAYKKMVKRGKDPRLERQLESERSRA